MYLRIPRGTFLGKSSNLACSFSAKEVKKMSCQNRSHGQPSWTSDHSKTFLQNPWRNMTGLMTSYEEI